MSQPPLPPSGDDPRDQPPAEDGRYRPPPQPGQPGQYGYGPSPQPGQYGPSPQSGQYGPPGQYGPSPQSGQYGPPGQYGPSPQPGQYGPSPQPGRYGQYGPPGQYGNEGEPGYPSADQQVGSAPYGTQPRAPGGTFTLGSLLGARGRRRPDARFSSALAGAGAALVIVGAFVWSIGYLAKGFGLDLSDDDGRPSVHGEGRRFLGLGLFVVLTAVGYALVVLRRRGPLATAGTVLSAFSVPAALGFAFLDISSTFTSGGFPINLDAVYLLSIGIWIASYLAVPGARGRAVYLAAAALSLPTYIAVKAAGTATLQVGFSAVSGNGLGTGAGADSHTGTVATIALIFGLGYYLIAALLDRAGRSGTAIGLLAPAFVVTASGISAAADDFGQVGTGVTLVVVGVLVALYGGRFGRRFTTWVWAAAAALGAIAIVAKLGTDDYLAIAIILIVVGAALAVAAHVAASALREQPDVVEEPQSAV